MDENVDIHLVRKYFIEDTWLLVEDVHKQKKANSVWICNICHKDLSLNQSIACESCLMWHHFKCVGLTKYPKKKNGFAVNAIYSL